MQRDVDGDTERDLSRAGIAAPTHVSPTRGVSLFQVTTSATAGVESAGRIVSKPGTAATDDAASDEVW